MHSEVYLFVCLGGQDGRAVGDGKPVYAALEKLWLGHLERAIQPATRKALSRAWDKWESWVRMAKLQHPGEDKYAPTLAVYCSFINFYLCLHTPESVYSLMKRVNTAAKERTGRRLTENLSSLIIKRTFVAGAARMGYTGSTPRLPLTIEILSNIKTHIDFNSHNDRALWAILCVGFFTLARIGELVPGTTSSLKVMLGSVSLRGKKGTLFLVGTKTDRMRKGTNLIFFKNKSACCPFIAMSAYLTARPAGHRTSPLFVDSNNKRISQAWVLDRLRAILYRMGLEGKHYSGISLRRGGAQLLLKQHANDTVIMGMGRWKSACFNRYIRCSDDEVESWQSKMAQSISVN